MFKMDTDVADAGRYLLFFDFDPAYERRGPGDTLGTPLIGKM
jgi:hypothetical protein